MKLIAIAASLTALSGVIGAPVAYNLVTASTAAPLASATPRATTGPQEPCAAPGIEQDGICVTDVVVTVAPTPAAANESAVVPATTSPSATKAASEDAPSPPVRTQHEANDDHRSGEAENDRDHD